MTNRALVISVLINKFSRNMLENKFLVIQSLKMTGELQSYNGGVV